MRSSRSCCDILIAGFGADNSKAEDSAEKAATTQAPVGAPAGDQPPADGLPKQPEVTLSATPGSKDGVLKTLIGQGGEGIAAGASPVVVAHVTPSTDAKVSSGR